MKTAVVELREIQHQIKISLHIKTDHVTGFKIGRHFVVINEAIDDVILVVGD
ncbi:hypothetical protein D3C87_2140010 [compost metagenome]